MPSSEMDRLSNIIGMIYDCVLDPQNWPMALCEIQDEFRFANAVLTAHEPTTGAIEIHVCTGMDEDFVRAGPEYASDVAGLWGGLDRAAVVPLEEPMIQSEATPKSTWVNNRYYRDILEPRGLNECLASILLRSPDLYGIISFGRHRDEGDIDQTIVDQMRLLMPHLRRAVSIGRLLEQQTIVAETFVETIDALRVGVILVGANLEVVHANVAARAMFGVGDPVQMRGGHLAVRSPLSAKVLAHAVAQAAHRETQMERRSIDIPALREGGAPAVLQVFPLVRRRRLSGLKKQDAVAAVFVADSASDLRTTASAMALLYNLTPAEARVFELIVDGRSPAEIADDLGLTLPTIRTHLSRVLSKTGCGRQAELVALSSRIPMFA